MKLITIGDIHGNTLWEDIIQKENNADFYVFLGDYFDSHDDVSATIQIHNFLRILDYKRKDERIILLFGNHDYHYIPYIDQTYSGYQYGSAIAIQLHIKEALDENLLQMCNIHDNLLFTHAGVTNTWCKNNNIDVKNSLAHDINSLFKDKLTAFNFTPGRYHSNVGDEICQTPIWVRPYSLKKDKVEGYVHIVGHTQQRSLSISDDIILCDTLNTSGEYLVYEDGKFSVGQIKK